MRRTWTRAAIRDELLPYGWSVRATGDRPGAHLSAFPENESASVFVAAIFAVLDLPPRVLGLAESMADGFASSPDGQAFSARCVAAVSIYMAAYNMRRSTGLTDIAWAAGTRMDDLVRVYKCMYPLREELVNMEDLERRGRGNSIRTLQAFERTIWPSLEEAERYLS